MECDPRFDGKLDLSGVVQQTLLEAYQARASFTGSTESERATWLRRILANNLTDEVRARPVRRFAMPPANARSKRGSKNRRRAWKPG